MWRAELALLLRRVRIKALLVVLAAVPILVAVAVRIAGSGPDPGVGPRFLDQVTNNGVFAGLVVLMVLTIALNELMKLIEARLFRWRSLDVRG